MTQAQPTTETKTNPAAPPAAALAPGWRLVRVTVAGPKAVAWAGRVWPSGDHETAVDPATAADLATAPAKLRVEFLDGAAPGSAAPPVRRASVEEELRASNERESFFRTSLATAETSYKVELERTINKHKGELDTLRAQCKAAIAVAEKRAEEAEADAADAREKWKHEAEPFVKAPVPAQHAAQQRSGR